MECNSLSEVYHMAIRRLTVSGDGVALWVPVVEWPLLGWEKYALSWDGGEPGGVSISTAPSVGEHGVTHRGVSSCPQLRFSFFLWNCCSTERPEGMLGVLGRSDTEDPGLEGSVEPPDQLKALRLVRWGGVSLSVSTSVTVLCVSPTSEGAWSDFSASPDSSFDSLDETTLRSELAKNLQEKPNESKHRTEAASPGKLLSAPLHHHLRFWLCFKKWIICTVKTCFSTKQLTHFYTRSHKCVALSQIHSAHVDSTSTPAFIKCRCKLRPRVLQHFASALVFIYWRVQQLHCTKYCNP